MLQNHIKIDPTTGQPGIAGTGIRVWDIYVQHERVGKTPDQIVACYPQLTLADVHAGLAYFWDNQGEIEARMKAADEFVDKLVLGLGPGPLAKKLSTSDSSVPKDEEHSVA